MLDSYIPFHMKTSKHSVQMTSQILETNYGKYYCLHFSGGKKEHLGTSRVSPALIKWGNEGGAQEEGGLKNAHPDRKQLWF